MEAEAESASIERARERVLVQLIDGQPQIVNADETMVDWKVRLVESKKRQTFRVRSYITRYAGVLQGDLGKSFRRQVGLGCHVGASSSLYILRIADVLFHLLVCVPLSIAKAMKHNAWFDNGSSVFIFMGYAVPGYVLGALMMVFLAARWESAGLPTQLRVRRSKMSV